MISARNEKESSVDRCSVCWTLFVLLWRHFPSFGSKNNNSFRYFDVLCGITAFLQPRTYNEGNTTGKEVIVMTGKKIISLFLALLMAFGVAAGPALAADAQAEMPAAAAEESVNTQVVENLVRALWGVASSLVPKVVDVNQLIDLGVFLVESVVYVMIQALVLQDYSIASERKLAVVARMGGQKWQLTKDIQVSEPIKVTAPIAFKLCFKKRRKQPRSDLSRDRQFFALQRAVEQRKRRLYRQQRAHGSGGRNLCYGGRTRQLFHPKRGERFARAS